MVKPVQLVGQDSRLLFYQLIQILIGHYIESRSALSEELGNLIESFYQSSARPDVFELGTTAPYQFEGVSYERGDLKLLFMVEH